MSEREFPLTDENLENLAPYLNVGEEPVDGPFWLVQEYYHNRRRVNRLEFQLETHRNLLDRLTSVLKYNWPDGSEACNAKAAAKIEEFLSVQELRPGRWDADSDIYGYLQRVLEEYIQDSESVQAVAVHEELPQVKAVLLKLITWIYNGPIGIDEEEAARLEWWRELGEVLPCMWD